MPKSFLGQPLPPIATCVQMDTLTLVQPLRSSFVHAGPGLGWNAMDGQEAAAICCGRCWPQGLSGDRWFSSGESPPGWDESRASWGLGAAVMVLAGGRGQAEGPTVRNWVTLGVAWTQVPGTQPH